MVEKRDNEKQDEKLYDPLQGARARCEHLRHFSNPRFGSDYVVALDYDAPADETLHWPINLKLRYIPDRLILDTASFHAYMAHLLMLKWQGLEQLASAVIEDFNNELVPYWVRVIAIGRIGQGDQTVKHRVYCEDRQPRWGNITLLASLSDD